MDMGGMDMGGATNTSTAAPASTSAPAMAMGMGGDCKISMLWNWNTVDSCFIAKSWHITSKGMFAGSCIGVVLLVMSLEFLRRASREYDRYIVLKAQRQFHNVEPASSSDSNTAAINPKPLLRQRRPTLPQQFIRALFHMVQFTVAYFIMLLAMYYNGYIIISIIIGAFLGGFIFSWEPINLGSNDKEEATLCCG